VDRDITLRDYARVVWSGRLLILAAVVVAMVVGLALTFARGTTYTATARVDMGQATTPAGIPVQTPLTNPTLAPSVLESDRVVEEVAEVSGVGAATIRDVTTLSAPRVTGQQGNLPTLLTVTVTDSARDRAITIANSYAQVIMSEVNRDFRTVQQVYERQLNESRAQVTQLTRELRGLRQQLVAAAGTDRAVALQTAVLSATDQLRAARQTVETQAVLLAKSNQVEAPELISVADSASSSGSAPARVRTALFAALIGLLIGILATFVWRGSPAGRAADGA
jgi:tyrosine-protein kinase Etk/Wzc